MFQFVRVEDIAYDPDSPRTVYFADTGTTRTRQTERRHRPPDPSAVKRYPERQRGRIFKMVLNENDPKVVDSFSIIARADWQQAGHREHHVWA